MHNKDVLTADELSGFQIAEELHQYLMDHFGDRPRRCWFMGIEKLEHTLRIINGLPKDL